MKTHKTRTMKAIRSKSQSKSQRIKEKKRAAMIRRELYEKWQRIEKTRRYLKAVNEETMTAVGKVIESECLDGIFIRLYERNEDLSYANKQRLLRRIIEKRQAQALNRKFANVNIGFVEAAIISNTSKCMAHIDRLRHAS